MAKRAAELEEKAEVDPISTMVSTVPNNLRKYISKSVVSRPGIGIHAEKYVPYRG